MALVRYNGKNVYYCNFTSRLMPGINEIPEGELKALLLHPLLQPGEPPPIVHYLYLGRRR